MLEIFSKAYIANILKKGGNLLREKLCCQPIATQIIKH